MGFTVYVLFYGLVALPPVDGGSREALLPRAGSVDVCMAHYPFLVALGDEATGDAIESFQMCGCEEGGVEPCYSDERSVPRRGPEVAWAPLNGWDIELSAMTEAGDVLLTDGAVEAYDPTPARRPPAARGPQDSAEYGDLDWAFPLSRILGLGGYSRASAPYDVRDLAARMRFGGGKLRTCSVSRVWNGSEETGNAWAFQFENPARSDGAIWGQVLAERVQWSRGVEDGLELVIRAKELGTGRDRYEATLTPEACSADLSRFERCVFLYLANPPRSLASNPDCRGSAKPKEAQHFAHYYQLFGWNGKRPNPYVTVLPDRFSFTANDLCPAFKISSDFLPTTLDEHCGKVKPIVSDLRSCPIVQ